MGSPDELDAQCSWEQMSHQLNETQEPWKGHRQLPHCLATGTTELQCRSPRAQAALAPTRIKSFSKRLGFTAGTEAPTHISLASFRSTNLLLCCVCWCPEPGGASLPCTLPAPSAPARSPGPAHPSQRARACDSGTAPARPD